MKNDIRFRVDADLSKVKWTPRDRYAVLNRIEEGGQEPVKKKLSVSAILVIAILAIGATVAVAEILGFNVFEIFGDSVERYKEIAPYTVLEQTSEVSVTSVELGTTVASINSAYYDGQSLIVGYFIRNNSRMEEFTPDDELISKMTKVDEAHFGEPTTDEEWELAYKWSNAFTQNRPMGIVTYSVYPSDHTTTDEGADIPPAMEYTKKGEDGMEYNIREYESPLPEELRELEKLNINISLYQSVGYLYFDGKDAYTYHERQVLEPMKATVWKTDAEFAEFEGRGRYDGLDYQVSVRATKVYAELEMTFAGESLPMLPDRDHWYVLRLTNEQGKALSIEEYDDSEPGKVRFVYEGNGQIPAELTLRIYVAKEGDFDEEAAILKAEPVALTRKK